MLTRRDYVIETLRHRKTDKLPYFLDIGEDTTRRMRAYTGDDAFFEHSDSYIAQERNESFTDLEGGRFRDMFGVVWDKGAQEGGFGIVAEYPLTDADFGDYVFPEPDEALIRENARVWKRKKTNSLCTSSAFRFSNVRGPCGVWRICFAICSKSPNLSTNCCAAS